MWLVVMHALNISLHSCSTSCTRCIHVDSVQDRCETVTRMAGFSCEPCTVLMQLTQSAACKGARPLCTSHTSRLRHMHQATTCRACRPVQMVPQLGLSAPSEAQRRAIDHVEAGPHLPAMRGGMSLLLESYAKRHEAVLALLPESAPAEVGASALECCQALLLVLQLVRCTSSHRCQVIQPCAARNCVCLHLLPPAEQRHWCCLEELTPVCCFRCVFAVCCSC